MDAIARFIIDRRATLSVVAVVLIGFAVAALGRLRLDVSILPILMLDDDRVAEVEAFDEHVAPRVRDNVFAVSFDEVVDSSTLPIVARMIRALESDDRIRHIDWIGNTTVVTRIAEAPVPLPFAATVAPGDRLIDRANRHPLLVRRMISADGKSLAFLVQASVTSSRDDEANLAFLEERCAELLPDGCVVRFVGDEVARRAMRRHMSGDLKRSLLIELLVFSILLPLIFRSVRGIAIPLIVVASSLALCLALVVWTDGQLGLIDLAVPGIITMIAVCDAVHMMHRFEECVTAGDDRDAAIADMMKTIGPACFFTSLTTAIGFISLLVARHPVVREFGLRASCAVLVTFVVIVILVPLLLAWWPVRAGIPARLPGISGLRHGRRRLTLAAFAAVLAFSVTGIGRLRVDAHWLEEMPAHEPLVENLSWFEDHFAGAMTMDVRLAGPLLTPEAVATIEELQRQMLLEPDVNAAESFTHWLREAAGNPERMTSGEIGRAVTLLEHHVPERLRHVLDAEHRTGRLTFTVDDSGSARYFELRREVDRLARSLPDGVTAEVAGFMDMAHEASRLVVSTMLESFLVSLAAISLLIAVIFRSWRMGIVSIVPNVLPVLVALGMNGWLDINLRIGIVMIYSLGLGLAVDDTIHVMTRYRQLRVAHPDRGTHAQVLGALRGAGPALVTTSVVLALGALAYLPSSFRSLHDVGLLLTLIVTTALLADLFVLPHLIEIAERRSERINRAS